MFRCADFVHLIQRHCDRACLAQDGDFEEAGVDGVIEICDLFKLDNGLARQIQDSSDIYEEYAVDV